MDPAGGCERRVEAAPPRAGAAGARRARRAATRRSTRARTPCRRRCSRPRGSGRATGIPDHPQAWLVAVAVAPARRRGAQRRRLGAGARTWRGAVALADERTQAPARRAARASTTTRSRCCCSAAIPRSRPPSQIALTLRAVGGLTTAEIASAFLVPEATMAQRISRAKAAIRGAGPRSRPPPADELPERLRAADARPLPRLQRGLHRLVRARAAARRPRRRGDPPHPASLRRLAPARRRGRRPARAHAAHRRAARRAHGRGRRARPARRAGPVRCGIATLIAEGVALVERGARERPAGPVPAAGGDRRGARGGARRGGRPTGRRSSRSTGCWSGSRRARRSR